jgi:hypothetical protein
VLADLENDLANELILELILQRIKHILYGHVCIWKFCVAYLIPIFQRYIVHVSSEPCLQSTYTPLQYFIFQALQSVKKEKCTSSKT